MERVLAQIESEIKLGTFDYAQFFPNSRIIGKLSKKAVQDNKDTDAEFNGSVPIAMVSATPLFDKFCKDWFDENEISWKRSYRGTLKLTLKKYLIPTFGEYEVGRITRSEILKFRSSLAKVINGKKEGLSPDRVNHIMTPLRMILEEAADRFDFSTPFTKIKPLKVPQTDVNPFTIDEVQTILETVRKDFRNYFTTRFFTALRTAEIDGLKWEYVDFEHRVIRVRETLVDMIMDTTKTPGSVRDVWMSKPVYDALKLQWEVTGHFGNFVFCNKEGKPLTHRNVTRRVWYPLLRYLGIKKRKPYQTRHTAATLWLAAGENPEWIARQMGHTSTRMLFTVYSRFVPNLTRQDGSAFERLIASTSDAKGGSQ